MPPRDLTGEVVGIIVESQFIPGEIEIYRRRFEELGATVELISNLWGSGSQQFYSTVEPGEIDSMSRLEVDVDFRDRRPNQYAAIIACANYSSVRLRWVPEDQRSGPPEQWIREASAVKFFRKAMLDPSVIKAAPCHSLWLLTPSPEVLAGRKVTCNAVVLADVINAGASYQTFPPGTPENEQIVVDGDLVTTTTWHASEGLIQRIAEMIVAKRDAVEPDTGVSRPGAPIGGAPQRRRRRILTVLSEWGYWGEELVGPVSVFDDRDYDVVFCTPTGKRPNAIPVSMDPEYVDPPLGRPVTSPEMARRAADFDNPESEDGARLETPENLSELMPDRPYHSHPAFLRRLEVYNRDLAESKRKVASTYDALLLVGGSGPIVDLANNQRVHDLIMAFVEADLPVAAECYGVACLAFARDPIDRRSIIAGKHVTGHCLEYDYKDGTGFVKARNTFLDFNMGPPPYPLEYILNDATAPDGQFHGNFGEPTSVIVDYPFITGRSTPDSVLTGEKLVEVLENGLKRWGW